MLIAPETGTGLRGEHCVGGSPMTETNLALPKLQHVTVTFPPGEERRLRDFYINVLGFKEKPVPKVVKQLGWIWFHTGAGGVELHTVPDLTPLPKEPTHHFCIEVDDLESERREHYHSGRVFSLGIRFEI
jgi:catechol 2,3-dioxygenase-like lactoylglutathione lyase family enzyme